MNTGSFEKTFWAGRWQNVANVQYYLQQALAENATQGLQTGVRNNLLAFERLYPKLLALYS